MEFIDTLNKGMDLLETIAILVICLSGVIAAVSVKAKTTADRLRAAAEAAVRATEQWRLLRLKGGQPDVSQSMLRQMASEKVKQLVPDLSPDQQTLSMLIEAAVNTLPKTRTPARGPDGKFTAAGKN